MRTAASVELRGWRGFGRVDLLEKDSSLKDTPRNRVSESTAPDACWGRQKSKKVNQVERVVERVVTRGVQSGVEGAGSPLASPESYFEPCYYVPVSRRVGREGPVPGCEGLLAGRIGWDGFSLGMSSVPDYSSRVWGFRRGRRCVPEEVRSIRFNQGTV